jgi:SAM-dependent methyltransferase
MSFPHHDRLWTEAAQFVARHCRPDDKILAPDIFHILFARIYRYANTRLLPDMAYDWAVIHKGELGTLSYSFLAALPGSMVPVLANEVFVVWSSRKNAAAATLAASTAHLEPYFDAFARLDPAAPLEDAPADRVLPDPGQIVNFARLDDDAFKEAMNRFWQNGGYEHDTLRDRALFDEVERCVASFVGDGSGKVVLDLGCGSGKLMNILTRSPSVVGVDISDVAVEMARQTHAGRPEFSFHVMDAHALDLPNAHFDTTLIIESIEHFKDCRKVMSEVARVTKPGGHLLVTTANRDSLHLVVNRKLGYPDFATSFQHIEEFSFAGLKRLVEDHGFQVKGSAGMFLYPYWGIPGVDGIVRSAMDNDPELVELMRVLGARVGAEHAYEFALWAQKPDV